MSSTNHGQAAEILLVGSGLTGLAVARQLDQFSMRYDWVSPACSIDDAGSIRSASIAGQDKVSFSYSPKLTRPDYILDQQRAEVLFGRIKTNNFRLSRSVRLGGLANYWGANTAKSYILSSGDPGIDAASCAIVDQLLPTISIDRNLELVPRECQALSRFLDALQCSSDALDMGGRVFCSELALARYPLVGDDLINFNPVVVGNMPPGSMPVGLTSGTVNSIRKLKDGYRVQVVSQGREGSVDSFYKSLILCAGPLENLRLLATMDEALQGQAFALQHHPIITGFLFARALPSSVKQWPLSCFDIHISRLLPDGLASECYVNMIPLQSALAVAFKKRPLIRRIASTALARWVISRVLVVNIYMPVSLSATYVVPSRGEKGVVLDVFGNYHPTLYSLLPLIKKRLRRLYGRCGMWLLWLRLLPPGTDQHLSSSLSQCCDTSSSFLSSRKDVESPLMGALLVPDASSVARMPICNPTYAFAARAVALVRSACLKGLISS